MTNNNKWIEEKENKKKLGEMLFNIGASPAQQEEIFEIVSNINQESYNKGREEGIQWAVDEVNKKFNKAIESGELEKLFINSLK